MKHLSHLFLIFLLGTGFFSCDKTWVFEKYQRIADAEWHKDSLIRFRVPVTDTLQSHNLLIGVRNTSHYKYSNLWLFLEMESPAGEMQKDTFNILLAQPSGEWLSEGIGKIKTRQAIFRRNLTFPHSGDYSISLQHGMREEVLKGIHDIGVRLEKVKNKSIEAEQRE